MEIIARQAVSPESEVLMRALQAYLTAHLKLEKAFQFDDNGSIYEIYKRDPREPLCDSATVQWRPGEHLVWICATLYDGDLKKNEFQKGFDKARALGNFLQSIGMRPVPTY